MKKFKLPMLVALTAIIASLLWFSCNKESLHLDGKILKDLTGNNGANLTPPGGIDTCALLISQIQTSQTGMLSFTNMDHFNKVLVCLENRVEDYNDSFEAAHPNTTDEEIEYIIDSLGWDEDQPLIDVENTFSFNSLRRSIETQLDAWLNNATLDPSTNPDNHVITDEETRSLLTPDCKAVIGGQVVDFCNPTQGGTLSPIQICSLSNLDCCWWGYDQNTVDYDGGSKKMIIYVSLFANASTIPPTTYLSRAKGKVLSCKREGNKWKRYRTHLRVQVGGETWSDNECGGPGGLFAKSKPNGSGTKRRKKLRVSTHSWFQGRKFAIDGSVSTVAWVGSNQQNNGDAPLNF